MQKTLKEFFANLGLLLLCTKIQHVSNYMRYKSVDKKLLEAAWFESIF